MVVFLFLKVINSDNDPKCIPAEEMSYARRETAIKNNLFLKFVTSIPNSYLTRQTFPGLNRCESGIASFIWRVT